MNAPQKPFWRAILLYFIPLTVSDFKRRMWAWGKQRRQRMTREAILARGLDFSWLRWLLSLCVLLWIAILVSNHTYLASAAAICSAVFSTLLFLYFCWILIRRLQFSLLELCLMIALWGSVEGLLIGTPNFRSQGFLVWSLIPLSAAWVLYGMVTAQIQMRILDVSKPALRILLLVGSWFVIASPAMLIAGLLLSSDHLFPKSVIPHMISPGMAVWSIPLLLLAGVGLGLRLWLDRKVVRAARNIIEEQSAVIVNLAPLTSNEDCNPLEAIAN